VNKPVETLDGFTDMNFGIWEGLLLKEVKERYQKGFEIWRHTPHKLRVQNGESLIEVRKRMVKGFEKVVPGEKGNVVIVTHRVLCKLMVLHALNIPNSHFWDIKFDPASITLIEKEGEELILRFMNDTCHLQENNILTGYKDF
jgi:probable phosphoglycerate mutase